MVRWVLCMVVFIGLGYTPNASADVSAFISRVGFDETTDLEDALGAGIRWGKSSRIIGGETSLMVARPVRDDENMTALFWEGRFLLNVPTGTNIRPFASVGLGNMLLTSIDIANPQLPTSGDELKEAAIEEALNKVDGDSGGLDFQNNRYLSYGGGLRYALSDKMAVRLDLRQYRVFSFKDYARDLQRNGSVKRLRAALMLRYQMPFSTKSLVNRLRKKRFSTANFPWACSSLSKL